MRDCILLTTNRWIFVTSVLTIGVAVALPRCVNTTTISFTFEFQFGTFERAIHFVAVVTAIVTTVANCYARRAIAVGTLESTRSTDTSWTHGRLVGSVLAILFSVTSENSRVVEMTVKDFSRVDRD